MNADVGGNCELTSPGETVVKHGVKIIGIKNLAGTIPSSASMLYSNNITNFVISISGEDGLILDSEDDILVGPSEDSDFFVEGMGGVLICSSGDCIKIKPDWGEFCSVTNINCTDWEHNCIRTCYFSGI